MEGVSKWMSFFVILLGGPGVPQWICSKIFPAVALLYLLLLALNELPLPSIWNLKPLILAKHF